TYAAYLKAAGILEKQFAKHPDHPGVAHYLIHSYDAPPIAPQGVAAARRYADIAPDAPHALHYMTYAYLQLGRDGEARKVLEEARGLTRINPARATGPYALAAMPARYPVERGAWRDTAELQPAPSNFPFTTAMTHFARALGAAR